MTERCHLWKSSIYSPPTKLMHWNHWNYTIEHRISEYKEKNINAAFEEGIQNERFSEFFVWTF